MEKIKKLSLERQVPILLFLWRWKLSTTAAIAAKFFSGKSLHIDQSVLMKSGRAVLAEHPYAQFFQESQWQSCGVHVISSALTQRDGWPLVLVMSSKLSKVAKIASRSALRFSYTLSMPS